MLQLKEVVKTYATEALTQTALKGVSIRFRKSEFVSILGPSGSGKTTLLNIIGGLDRYTSGDLLINGVSTRDYRDRDWDAYRNRSIGFVFQSYQLIPHQSVLSNVELALTLAGVSRKERRARAEAVLEQVGLRDHIHKKPNQLSGGQMQRVAIARALINNPEILLADEPTGALDSETSVQIMGLLKEIAREKLVIMVTHNPELAESYSTRIVRLLDGEIVSDSNPYDGGEGDTVSEEREATKVSMSFWTALSLSLQNLRTKKGRTILTAFAGSIGIIGIAMILSLSSGMKGYITQVEEDALSTYPITIESQGIDLLGEQEKHMAQSQEEEDSHDTDRVYQGGYAGRTLERQTLQLQNNDLARFKQWLEQGEETAIREGTSAIQYGYSTPLCVYRESEDGMLQVNPSPLLEEENPMPMAAMGESMGISGDIWTEMMDNRSLLEDQYDVLAGRWPSSYDEVVLLVNENNEISDLTLYTLGLKDGQEVEEMKQDLADGKELDESQYEKTSYSYEELLNLQFRVLPVTAYYEKVDGAWIDRREDEAFMEQALEKALPLRVVGILRPSESAAAAAIGGSVGYTKELTEYLIDQVNQSDIAKEQKENPEINVFTGREFISAENMSQEELLATLSPGQQAQMRMLTEAERTTYLDAYAQSLEATYEDNLETLGIVDREKPSSVSLYLKGFESREQVIDAINRYNQEQQDQGHEEYVITYTDMVGIMMDSVKQIIDMISYLLIGFVSISLVVSSIMIGIITYISVLERTREIGILRSIGASKRDISRVFNAETVLVGLAAGLIGIGLTLLLLIPLNLVIEHLSGVSALAALPPLGGVILVVISVVLTMIAGLIPSRLAAKKDPVVALRTE